MNAYKSPTILVGSPEYHERTTTTTNGPIYLMMNLPTSCSLGCKKCALGGTKRDVGPIISMDERKQIIRKASLAGIKTLVIIGNGEPTENFPTMAENIGTAYECGMGTIMFTTTNRLDRGQAEFFAGHNVSIIVSLDSLQAERYRWLTGNGDLAKVKANIAMLREVYAKHMADPIEGKRVVRLGINTTVSFQNLDELAEIRAFAGDDMQFVANPPMKRGRLQRDALWTRLILGETVKEEDCTEEAYQAGYDKLKTAAELHSSTGGHSSLSEGVCGYFYNGVSVDIDGEFLTCGYADETAKRIGNALQADPAAFLRVNGHVRSTFAKYTQNIGHTPSCPVRDEEFQKLVRLL